MLATIAALNAGWVLFALAILPHHFHYSGLGIGLGVTFTGWTLGCRHAFDADHIAAIDNAWLTPPDCPRTRLWATGRPDRCLKPPPAGRSRSGAASGAGGNRSRRPVSEGGAARHPSFATGSEPGTA